jgi:hypothetical protein
MADKKFGVRQIDLVGTSGATNIESPNTLNLKSNQVAISTDVSVGGNVVSNLIVGAGFSVGIGTTIPETLLDVFGGVKAGVNTSHGVILTAPNGTQYRLFVENDGSLSTVSI